jgi:hypothetical protein
MKTIETKKERRERKKPNIYNVILLMKDAMFMHVKGTCWSLLQAFGQSSNSPAPRWVRCHNSRLLTTLCPLSLTASHGMKPQRPFWVLPSSQEPLRENQDHCPFPSWPPCSAISLYSDAGGLVVSFCSGLPPLRLRFGSWSCPREKRKRRLSLGNCGDRRV